MHTITVYNYEAYLLDSVEGNLTGEQQLELEVFLIEHPELCVDLEDIPAFTFNPQKTIYSDKAQLKKTGSELVSEEQFISYIEKQASAEEKKHIEKSCASNIMLAKELDLYKNTIALADDSIIFDTKENLKRKPKVLWFNFPVTQFAAAASVALLIFLYFLWPGKTTEHAKLNSYATHQFESKVKAILKNHNILNEPVIIEKQLAVTNARAKAKKQIIPSNTFTKNNNAANATILNTAISNPVSPDTSAHVALIKEPIPVPEKESVAIESPLQKTVVEVISENDDEKNTGDKKQGFWAIAGKTLKGLNKAGVKSVNGEESNNKEDATYALTLGGLNITHSSH